MKIGIITYHATINYGATFQAQALHIALSNYGHNVVFIDYLPEYLDIKKRTNLRHLLKNIWTYYWGIINIQQYQRRYVYFSDYRKKHLAVTDCKYTSCQALSVNKPNCDFFIAGSDQIWNPHLSGNELDPVFFLTFVNQPEICAAYGASLGSDRLEDKYISKFQEYLTHIKYISVRERSSISFIIENTDRDVIAVVDPTLLITKEEWKKHAVKPSSVPEKRYLLVYVVSFNFDLNAIITKVSKELHLPIKYIGSGRNKFFPIASYVRPEEWLWYFANASFVITDSFHGTVFSIINNKPFYTIHSSPKKTRIIDLLTPLGLEDRFYEYEDEITKISTDIDYASAMKKLNPLREKSLNYLKEITREETSQ